MGEGNPILAAKRKSYDEFFEEFGGEDFGYVSPSTGYTLLGGALTNPDPKARYAMANRLLDEGADADYQTKDATNALHAVLGQRRQEFAALAPLLRRLLDGGADVNLVAPKFGTPLQIVASLLHTPEEELLPVYDVLFARDDLDLLGLAGYGQSTLDLARKQRERKPELLRRMEQYLHDRGIEVPNAQEE